MVDDVSTGELDRRIRDHEMRSVQEHQTLHARISKVSSDSVQMDVQNQVEKDRDKEMAAVIARLVKVETRPGLTWSRALAGATVVVGIIALLLQAYATVRGAQ